MRNEAIWAPTKFVRRGNRLMASADPKMVGVGSRLMAQTVAAFYDRVVPLHARGRLLDLGCGTVPLFQTYRDFVVDVTCVDWQSSPHTISHVDIEHDLNTPLPFSDERFDTIILSDVLEHVFEPERLFQEIARVLSVEGKVLMNAPFYYWIHERPHDYYRYTEYALKRFATNAGLSVVEISALGGAPEVVADVLAKVLARRKWGRPVASVIQTALAWFTRRRRGGRPSNGTRTNFPFAYAMVAQKQ